MAGFEGPGHLGWIRCDGPLEHCAGEIQAMTISLDDDGRSIELSGVLEDGRRWTSTVPMPRDWQLVRHAPGTWRSDKPRGM